MSDLIIALSGKKFSGKTITSNMLKEKFRKMGVNAKKMSFAGPLKDIAHMIFGIPYGVLYGDDKIKAEFITDVEWKYVGSRIKKYSRNTGKLSARDLLQLIGTDIFRNMIDENIWVKSAIRSAKNEGCRIIIFDDCRFPNEVDAVLNNNGRVIRLNRCATEPDTHLSEMALDGYDWNKKNCFVVESSDSLSEHRKVIDDLFEELNLFRKIWLGENI